MKCFICEKKSCNILPLQQSLHSEVFEPYKTTYWWRINHSLKVLQALKVKIFLSLVKKKVIEIEDYTISITVSNFKEENKKDIEKVELGLKSKN